MLRNLLVCGLIAGACAGLLATGFAELTGEPAVGRAIVFEQARAISAGRTPEAPVVSRTVQRSVGLLVMSVVYGLALGGLFALVFAAVYGRVGRASPARTALWLAAAAFLVLFLVPFVKYPANPPAVGNPETIGKRTELYGLMIAISLFAAVAGVRVRRSVGKRRSTGASALVAIACYIVVVAAAGVALPGIDEVPSTFPAVILWRFREAAVGTQIVMWAVIGLIFAAGAQRLMAGREGRVRLATPSPSSPASPE